MVIIRCLSIFFIFYFTITSLYSQDVVGKNIANSKKDDKNKQVDSKILSETYIDENGITRTRLFRYGFQTEKKTTKPIGTSQKENTVDEYGRTASQKFKYGFQYLEKKASTTQPMLDTSPKAYSGVPKSAKKKHENIAPEAEVIEETNNEKQVPAIDVDEIKKQVEDLVKKNM